LLRNGKPPFWALLWICAFEREGLGLAALAGTGARGRAEKNKDPCIFLLTSRGKTTTYCGYQPPGLYRSRWQRKTINARRRRSLWQRKSRPRKRRGKFFPFPSFLLSPKARSPRRAFLFRAEINTPGPAPYVNFTCTSSRSAAGIWSSRCGCKFIMRATNRSGI